MKRQNGNAVSFGHQALTEWGDRYDSLGAPSIGTLGRMVEDGAVAAACKAEGLHGDPTLSNQLRDEELHACNHAWRSYYDLNPEGASVLKLHYVYRLGETQIANRGGLTPRQVRDMLISGQSWIGCKLMLSGCQQFGREMRSTGTGF